MVHDSSCKTRDSINNSIKKRDVAKLRKMREINLPKKTCFIDSFYSFCDINDTSR